MAALASFLFYALLAQADRVVKETPVLPQHYLKPTKGPSLSEVAIRVPVSPGGSGTVTLPVPSTYSGQATVSLQVRCDPPGSLIDWKLEARPDKLNSLIVAHVEPGANGALLSYSALVLCPGEPVYRTELKVSKPWLAATACVQSTDPEIKALSLQLKKRAKERDDYVRSVVLWVARNKGTGNAAAEDAKQALEHGGDSLGRANLCAALLRANGIPARTIAEMPIWASSRIDEQWLTQYQTDDGYWQMVDPTVGILNVARNTVVVLAIPSPEDENKSFDTHRLVLALPGTPYMSVPEFSGGLKTPWKPSDPSSDEVQLVKIFPMQFNGRMMVTGFRRSLRVLDAAKKGQSAPLDFKEVLKAIAKNPGQLAFLLERS